MAAVVKVQVPEVRIRAFRAIEEPKTCELFICGHSEVLTSIGVTKVTSAKNEWVKNPNAFVIIVESLDGKVVFGGGRVHVAGGSAALPIEQATGSMDPGIYGLVENYARYGTGEICGLWNSQTLAGYGIGTPLLIRTLIAIAPQLGIRSLFALCAPYTVHPVVNCGMELIEEIGNKGTFYYPKTDLIATAMILKDLSGLKKAHADDRDMIMNLRADPNGVKINELKKREISIDFKIEIAKLDQWDLTQAIKSTIPKGHRVGNVTK